jgi:type I restriction enzyme S subunit
MSSAPAVPTAPSSQLKPLAAAFPTTRLKNVASIRLSGVDTKTEPNGLPVHLCNYTDVYHRDQITADLPFMAATASPKEIARFTLAKGDVIITKDSETADDIGVAALVSEDLPGVLCGYHLALIRPDQTRLEGTYLFYALQARTVVAQLEAAAQGITRHAVGQLEIGNLLVPLPDLLTQQAIAAHLAAEFGRLDTMLAEIENQAALLEEAKASATWLAVGGAPSTSDCLNAEPWLAPLPKRWSHKRLAHLTDPTRPIMYGIVLPGRHVPGGIPIIKGGNCRPERLRIGLTSRTTREIDEAYARARVRPGDIVFAIRGSVGDCAIVPGELDGANLTQDAARVARHQGVDSRWLWYALQSPAVRAQAAARMIGATVKGLNIRDLKRIVVSAPPVTEQRNIARELDGVFSELEGVGLQQQRVRTLVGEYRAALISATVTGQRVPTLEPA